MKSHEYTLVNQSPSYSHDPSQTPSAYTHMTTYEVFFQLFLHRSALDLEKFPNSRETNRKAKWPQLVIRRIPRRCSQLFRSSEVEDKWRGITSTINSFSSEKDHECFVARYLHIYTTNA
jgi:hypothetical protein